MTTPAKLYGKDLSEYDEVDVDELLAQLSAEEIKILAKEVDPDVSGIFVFRVYFALALIASVAGRTTSCPRTSATTTSARKSRPAR